MEASRRVILLLIAGVVLTFGIVALRSVLGTKEPEAPVVEQKQHFIVIAKRDLPQGTIIDPLTDIEWKPFEPPPEAAAVFPQDGAPPETAAVAQTKPEDSYFHDSSIRIESLAGSIVRRPVRAGDPLTQDMLTRAGLGGFMSAVLEPGMRAVSIAVSPTSGNAGFISPGDRVDLIVTHRAQTGSANSGTSSVISETFVRDVRVIAVDQQIENTDSKAILAKTVTVEVTPRQAEQVAVAGDLGKISLVLRSMTATDKEQLTGGYTSDRDVSGALEAGGIASTIRVIRGDQIEHVAVH